jgi:predicted PurR-regulated permease PerM
MALLVGGLAFLCLLVLRPFLAPMVWATILAYATWPLYCRLRAPFRKFTTAAAAAMTLLVVSVGIVPFFALLVLMQRELVDAYRAFTVYLAQGPHELSAAVRDIPWLGPSLQESLNRYTLDPAAVGRELTAALQGWKWQFGALLGGVGRNLGKLFVALISLFFFYRDGDSIVQQIQRVANRFFDHRLDRYAHSVGTMTRAVLYGLLITAVAQGVIAGVGYWIFGLDAPAVLGALTGLLSIVPLIGTALVWAPAAVGLLIAGHTWKGILLLAWGSLLVHPVDNLLRPYLISSATRVPFLLVMFGALGGLTAFGLVGLFIGPVILGVASAIWREWATEAS